MLILLGMSAGYVCSYVSVNTVRSCSEDRLGTLCCADDVLDYNTHQPSLEKREGDCDDSTR
jgi:hypothetical protein